MDSRRFITFVVGMILIMLVNYLVWNWFAPPKPPAAKPPVAQKKDDKAPGAKPGVEAAPADHKPDKKPDDKPDDKPAENPAADNVAGAEPQADPAWATIGSIDPASGYRMLVTLTNRGAAVERIELNSQRYHELNYDAVTREEIHSGYLGHLAETDAPDKKGCLVRVVGRGTPADEAGLKAGDVIVAFDDVGSAEEPISARRFRETLGKTVVGQQIKLIVAGRDKPLVATLRPRQLSVVQPEGADPLSFLLTLDSVDKNKIPRDEEEMAGVDLRNGHWKLLPGATAEEVAFSRRVPKYDLEVIKRFRLAKAPDDQISNAEYKAYHLELAVEIRNTGAQARDVAYRLDGPTGLPVEGFWYAYKISSGTWGTIGVRDVVIGQWNGDHAKAELVSCSSIADDPNVGLRSEKPLSYIAVDALYFSVAMIPQLKTPSDKRFAESTTLRVGPVDKDSSKKNLTDVSCRVVSEAEAIAPDQKLSHGFQVFAGPKQPALLGQYKIGESDSSLEDLVDYGWFSWVSTKLLWLLHFFYGIVGNYGIAIIMLTVLVRLCMFPISRKQALNAQKMQELQPEMKKIAEKYKNNLEQRGKAQQELWKKNNYSPLSGCLPMFMQLPIFIGLYRSLSVDVELRQAPLISETFRWCSNLGAPDMLWYWESWSLMPAFITKPVGTLFLIIPTLGPYLNLLPLFTIALFIVQQKMFMPPPTDEQTAMQAKMMKYMMVLMGFMFFKVAAGLCIYFIASSLWSIAEKKLLPKTLPAAAAGGASPRPALAASGGNGATSGDRKKQGGRK